MALVLVLFVRRYDGEVRSPKSEVGRLEKESIKTAVVFIANYSAVIRNSEREQILQ